MGLSGFRKGRKNALAFKLSLEKLAEILKAFFIWAGTLVESLIFINITNVRRAAN